MPAFMRVIPSAYASLRYYLQDHHLDDASYVAFGWCKLPGDIGNLTGERTFAENDASDHRLRGCALTCLIYFFSHRAVSGSCFIPPYFPTYSAHNLQGDLIKSGQSDAFFVTGYTCYFSGNRKPLMIHGIVDLPEEPESLRTRSNAEPPNISYARQKSGRLLCETRFRIRACI